MAIYIIWKFAINIIIIISTLLPHRLYKSLKAPIIPFVDIARVARMPSNQKDPLWGCFSYAYAIVWPMRATVNTTKLIECHTGLYVARRLDQATIIPNGMFSKSLRTIRCQRISASACFGFSEAWSPYVCLAL